MAKTFSSDIEEEIYQQFVSGKTRIELSREYNVPIGIIFNVIRRQSKND